MGEQKGAQVRLSNQLIGFLSFLTTFLPFQFCRSTIKRQGNSFANRIAEEKGGLEGKGGRRKKEVRNRKEFFFFFFSSIPRHQGETIAWAHVGTGTKFDAGGCSQAIARAHFEVYIYSKQKEKENNHYFFVLVFFFSPLLLFSSFSFPSSAPSPPLFS